MLNIGDEIKDYTLVKFLGKGGFGEVWLAEKKIELADKRVPFALKFISGENRGGTDLDTVKREVNTWIEASGNKQVVSVMDGFMHGETFVIVSEYADGGSLRHWLKENGGKAPSIEKAVELMGGILDGLTHLHSNRIIHRDLKPENILLKGEVPCIADFGVSRVVQTLAFGETFGTNAAGSPHYMSPESFERIIPSPQVDIWSAGVILYEMLCGKFPYQADTVPALVFEIITKDPKPMPPTVPNEIQNVVKKALSKHAVERYSSAKEMRDSLLKAFYLQDQVPTVTDEEIKKSKESADTLRKSIPFVEAETMRLGFTESATRKMFSWTVAARYVAAGLTFFIGAFGLVTWALLGVNNSKNAPVMSNKQIAPSQTEMPETSPTPQSNVASNTSMTPGDLTTNKTNANTTEPKTKTVQSPTKNKKQTDTQSKPKQTTKQGKKPTIDDLINRD